MQHTKFISHPYTRTCKLKKNFKEKNQYLFTCISHFLEPLNLNCEFLHHQKFKRAKTLSKLTDKVMMVFVFFSLWRLSGGHSISH